jgi:hypothetical protein
MTLPQVSITLPDWVAESVAWESSYASDEDRMRLAIELSRQNVLHGTGGPFGAVIFERGSGGCWRWG